MPEALAHRLYVLISKSYTPQDFHAGLRGAQRRFDNIGNEIADDAPKPLACRAECSLCCSLRVELYVHEVFLIAHHLQAATDPADLKRIRKSLAAHVEQLRPLTRYEHATRNIV